jgi:MFS family permease
MLALIRRRPAFRRLWMAGALSQIGDWLGFVAVSLLAFDQGGGALELALVFAVHQVPRALLTPLAGVVTDRFDRRRLLLAVPLVEAMLTLGMALGAARGALPLVQVLVLMRSAATAFMVPAEIAAVRHTVEPDELLPANAILSGTWSVCYVAGMALGGVIAVLGPAPAIVIDACSFLLAAALLRGLPPMRVSQEAPASRARPVEVITAMPRDLWTALSHALPRPRLLRSLFAKSPVALAGGAGWIVLNIVANRERPFVSAAISLGVLQAVRGAGTGLGPGFISLLPERLRTSWAVEHIVVLLAFAGIALFPVFHAVPVLLAAMALLWGTGTGSNWVLSSAALQRHAPDAMIGRLASIDDLAVTLTMVMGSLVAGALVDRGIAMPLIAAWGVTAGAVCWALLVRASRHDRARGTALPA